MAVLKKIIIFPRQKLHLYLQEKFKLFTVFHQIFWLKHIVTGSNIEVHSRKKNFRHGKK